MGYDTDAERAGIIAARLLERLRPRLTSEDRAWIDAAPEAQLRTIIREAFGDAFREVARADAIAHGNDEGVSDQRPAVPAVFMG